MSTNANNQNAQQGAQQQAQGNTQQNQQTAQQNAATATQQAQGNGTNTEIDYEKLAGIVAGKQSVAEDTVLKNYFKQQGLTGDEMNAAISAFKQQKAAQTPDVGALQGQLKTMQAQLAQAAMEQAATIEAIKLGISVEAVPYVLKMADLSSAVKDGKPDAAAIQKIIGAVVEAIPGLKKATAVTDPAGQTQGNNAGAQTQNTGFVIGAANQQVNGQTAQTQVAQNKPVASKRWNRFH